VSEITRPLFIQGRKYFCAGEIVKFLSVSRQTLWRWRKEGKIPAGKKYRGREVLFEESEIQDVIAYAERLEPVAAKKPRQLKLL
jgi:predicted DNA-binding transcriptional regulator AlpA